MLQLVQASVAQDVSQRIVTDLSDTVGEISSTDCSGSSHGIVGCAQPDFIFEIDPVGSHDINRLQELAAV